MARDDDSMEKGTCTSMEAEPESPLREVVLRTVREVSGNTWPQLTRTNYGEWAVTMKVKLWVRKL